VAVDEAGGLVPRGSEDVSGDHAWLAHRQPALLESPPGDLLAWHDAEARSAEAIRAWAAALPHLGHLVTAEPENPSYLARRGRAHAELGHWTDAAPDYGRAVDAGSEDRMVWYECQLLRLRLGNPADYRRSCVELLARVGDTPDPKRASDVAYICALAPDAVPDPGRVVALAIRALRRLPADDVDALNTLGAALYRAGKYPEAIERLKESVRLSKSGEGSEADWIFLAMAYHRLGRATEAREWLDKAVRAAAGASESAGDAARPDPPHGCWQDVIHRAILLGEARALIDRRLPGGPPE
jgi:tetratricopeptide (TPR) repeat protein